MGVVYHWEGEFAIEADSEDEARELVRDELFGDPWTDSDGNSVYEINEVYEWDNAAQERNYEEVKELFAKYKTETKL